MLNQYIRPQTRLIGAAMIGGPEGGEPADSASTGCHDSGGDSRRVSHTDQHAPPPAVPPNTKSVAPAPRWLAIFFLTLTLLFSGFVWASRQSVAECESVQFCTTSAFDSYATVATWSLFGTCVSAAVLVLILHRAWPDSRVSAYLPNNREHGRVSKASRDWLESDAFDQTEFISRLATEADGISTRAAVILGFLSIMITLGLGALPSAGGIDPHWDIWALLLLALSAALLLVCLVLGWQSGWQDFQTQIGSAASGPQVRSEAKRWYLSFLDRLEVAVGRMKDCYQLGVVVWLLGVVMLLVGWLSR
jgi:hypothetical protein